MASTRRLGCWAVSAYATFALLHGEDRLTTQGADATRWASESASVDPSPTPVMPMSSAGGPSSLASAVAEARTSWHVPFMAVEPDPAAEDDVRFRAVTSAASVFVSDNGLRYLLPTSAPHGGAPVVLSERFVGALEGEVEGGEPSSTRVSTFAGADPSRWTHGQPTWNSLRRTALYPGIDLTLRMRGSRVEKVFEVGPGAPVSAIAIAVDGASRVEVLPTGELQLDTPRGTLHLTAPLAWQGDGVGRRDIAVAYAVGGGRTYGFAVGDYDSSRPLLIDPVLKSTLLGAPDTTSEIAEVAVGPDGSVYVTGRTRTYAGSTFYPTTAGAYDTSSNLHQYDVVISKLSADLSSLLASTFVGGGSDDHGVDLALDSAGNVFVGGATFSTDFPTTDGAYDRERGGAPFSGWDGFVIKLDASLTTLLASTYLGGYWYTGLDALDIGPDGHVYVVGTDDSDLGSWSSLPPGGYDRTPGGWGDAYVARLNSGLTSMTGFTLFGGGAQDKVRDVVVNASGVYVAGFTDSVDLPTTAGAYDPAYSISPSAAASDPSDAYVAKFDHGLNTLLASTFLGGKANDEATALALDSRGHVFVTGSTSGSGVTSNGLPRSDFFPTTDDAYDPTYNGGWDVFVSRLSADLSALEASTFIGSAPASSAGLQDQAYALTVDPVRGDVFVTGYTSGTYPTTTRAWQEASGGAPDVFITRLDWKLSKILASTYLGGAGGEWGYAIALDGPGNVYAAGATNSWNFPTSADAFDPTYEGTWHQEGFVARLPASLGEPGVAVSVTGPSVVSPGQRGTFLVRYRNAYGFRLQDVVVVVDVPLGTELISATGGGTYHPGGTCNGQVYWAIASLESGEGGSASFTIEVPWGAAEGTNEVLVRGAASNEPYPLFDMSLYTGYVPPPPPESRALSTSELESALDASPQARRLLDYLEFLGYRNDGVAYAISAGGGPATVLHHRLWLMDPAGLPVSMTWDSAAAFAERFLDGSYTRFDRDGGFTWDRQVQSFSPFGSLAVSGGAATGNAKATCLFNCGLTKVNPAALRRLGRSTLTMMKTADCVACAAAIAAGTGDLASAQCRRCASAVANALQATPFLPVIGSLMTAGSSGLACQTQCTQQPTANRCTADSHWCCDTATFKVLPDGTPAPRETDSYRHGLCYQECNLVTGRLSPATLVGMCPSLSACRTQPPGTPGPRVECSPVWYPTTDGGAGVSWQRTPFSMRVARDPNAKSAFPDLVVLPAETITYTIEYENVGAGQAEGVFILDTLDANLDETTLVVNDGGIYTAGLRLLQWDIGTLAPTGETGSKGSVTFTVKPKAGLSVGTEIVNQAEVHFPSAFEVTPTNPVVHTIVGAAADPLTLTTAASTPMGITLTGRSASGQPLTFALATSPVFGTLTGTPPALVYTPQANFTGGDAFTFTVHDGVTVSEPARVTILVTPGAADTTPPQITATWPVSSQTAVPFSTTPMTNTTAYLPIITATVSEALDPSTVTGTSVGVAGVTGNVTYDGQLRQIRFVPTVPLAAGTSYTATITSAVKDATGNALPSNYAWSFTTALSSAPNITVSLPNQGQDLQMAMGFASRRQVVAVVNTGNATLTVGSLALIGSDAADFALRNDYCSSTSVGPGALCSVEVEYAPGVDGTKAASLQIPSNDPDTPVATVALASGGPSAPAPFTYYLAEGATGSLFDTHIAIANPNATAARGLLTFLKQQGAIVTQDFDVGAMTRWTADVPTIPGMDQAEFSTTIESDQPLIVDRTMMWDASGYGSHAERSIAGPSTVWYLAEGATHSGFDLFYLIQNPGATTAHVQVKYLLPAPAAPVLLTYTVDPKSRFNIWVDTEAGLGTTDVSAVITADAPIIVERAMYLTGGGQLFRAGHESAGITTPATAWFFAEGATGDFFDLFILLANPSTTDAEVRGTYLLPDGRTIEKTYTVAASSRFNIWVDTEDARLADTAVSTTITSTNGVPIIGERAMWWPGPTAATWSEAHNSAGSTTTGTMWAMAEGEQEPVHGTETYILIANTSAYAGTARVTLLFEDGTTAQQDFALFPSSRMNVAVGADFPEAAGRRFGAIVESLGSTPAQIVVERAMYSNTGGTFWAAGTNALATKMR